MDSRNQMLFGYYAFGEFEFPRANLQLISRDNRKDGLLAICYPIKLDLAIPSFSLHYFTECLEYYEYSEDKSLLLEVYPKLCSIISAFTDKMAVPGDVILPFKNCWNFYEWSTGLDGHGGYNANIPDLPLNALLSIALKNMDSICKIIDQPTDYGKLATKLNESINNAFFDAEKGLYFDQADTKRFSKLSNSLAILCGAAEGKLAEDICQKLTEDNCLTEITLSMQTFFFDALLKCNKDKYRDYVLESIETKYRPMVEYGVGTVWETELGQADFENAGSLCHGWSALPIYYYHILKK
jgi:glycogen debranching enzyme